jgi:hypothetical protein
MIGGVDVVIPAVDDGIALETCARIVQHYWPNARFEDPETGEKFARCCDVPLRRVRELIVYSDVQAEAAWDADCEDSPTNSMLYLIRSSNSITVVLDDPNAADMQAMLEELRTRLREPSSNEGSQEKSKRLLK